MKCVVFLSHFLIPANLEGRKQPTNNPNLQNTTDSTPVVLAVAARRVHVTCIEVQAVRAGSTAGRRRPPDAVRPLIGQVRVPAPGV
jgi:hypothetical protein